MGEGALNILCLLPHGFNTCLVICMMLHLPHITWLMLPSVVSTILVSITFLQTWCCVVCHCKRLSAIGFFSVIQDLRTLFFSTNWKKTAIDSNRATSNWHSKTSKIKCSRQYPEAKYKDQILTVCDIWLLRFLPWYCVYVLIWVFSLCWNTDLVNVSLVLECWVGISFSHAGTLLPSWNFDQQQCSSTRETFANSVFQHEEKPPYQHINTGPRQKPQQSYITNSLSIWLLPNTFYGTV